MRNELAYYQKSLSTGSLSSYIHWTNQIPLLTLEEEQDLANRLIKFNDLEAARKLVMSHLRFVVRLAKGYSGYGLQEADLIQEGNIGLMKAVKRFNPEVGVRLVSFAVHWIRAEIHEFVLRNWRIVKIATTKAQRKLFFNLRKMAKKGTYFSQDEVKAIATELNVKDTDVRQMEQRLYNYDESFDTRDSSDDEDWSAPSNYLENKSAGPEDSITQNDWTTSQNEQLYVALEKLDPRSQDILKQRWLSDSKLTLHDLADKYSVSAERIRQLEKAAMAKLRTSITQH